jgi:type IV pilus assembly protein PilN
MIRINLLATGRRAKKPAGAAFAQGQWVTALCLLILIGSAAGIGWWWYGLGQESARLDADVAAAQQEAERLQSVLKQVQLFESQKAQLEQRVKLIEELRKGQAGPVHLLDEISRSLPELMWLTELKQQGSGLTIEGRATTLTALSDFVGNLEGSRYFKRPVEIVNSQLDPQPQGELIRFSVKAEFAAPGS